jgi:hypothetical protein
VLVKDSCHRGGKHKWQEEERIWNNPKTALIRSFDGSHKIAIIKGIRGRRI